MITLASNFENLKSEFKKDTRLDADLHLSLYLKYYEARMADNNMQSSVMILQELKKLKM